jgi:hypothetical protein
MMDFVDVLLEAQNQEVACEKIVGDDVTKFCDTFFGDYSFAERLRGFLHSITFCCWELVLIGLVIIRFEDWENHIFQPVSLNLFWGFVLAVGLSSFVEALLTLFQMNKERSKKNYIIKLIIQLSCSIVLVMLLASHYLAVFLFLVGSMYLVVFYISAFLVRYLVMGTFPKRSSDYEAGFWETVRDGWNEETRQQKSLKLLAEGLAKRYEKINQKRIRKGKEVWDTETFFQYMKREFRYSIVALFFILGGIVVELTINVSKSSTLFDTIGFFVICSFVEILWGYLCYKFAKMSFSRYEKVQETCNSEGMTLFEYVKKEERE